MQFVRNIDSKELNEFVLYHPFSHYMKTSFWADYKRNAEKYQTEYVGVEEKGELIATAVILKKREFYCFKPYFYIPTAMCVDFYNRELLDFFLDSLIAYAKEQKASFLRIDPNVERWHKDINGNLIDDGFNNEEIAEYLKKKGFYTRGYGYAYNGSWINRFTLKINLEEDMDTIVSRFNKSRQNILKRQGEQGISTRYGKREELHYLRDFEFDLTKTQGFKPHTIQFFETLFDNMKENIHFYVTEINIDTQIAFFEEELAGKKYRKDPEAREAKERDLAAARERRKKYGSSVVIACGVYIHYGTNSWDLYSYMRKDFNNYNATDNLHRFVIEDMKNRGVIWYDMCGFPGNTNKDDEYYGLYNYKRSFGSEWFEHIGEFDYIVDEHEYQKFKFIYRNIRRVYRKVNSLRYKEK